MKEEIGGWLIILGIVAMTLTGLANLGLHFTHDHQPTATEEQHARELFHARFGTATVIDTLHFTEAAMFEYTAETATGIVAWIDGRPWILVREPIEE